MAHAEARIEAQHGPNCTCERLEPISFQPVIAGPNCPGDPTRYVGIPTEESVIRGEHSPNDLRRHRGITGSAIQPEPHRQ